MKRFLAMVPLVAVLLLTAGCGATTGGTGVGSTVGAILSGSVDNPVTPARALALRATFKATVLIPASVYVSWPRCSASSGPICSKQSIVRQLRTYINPTVDLLRKLSAWANGNKALDGPALFRAASIAVSSAQAFATANIPASAFKQ